MSQTVPANTGEQQSIADLQLRGDRRLAMIGLALVALPSLWFVRTDFALFSGNWSALSGRFLVRAVMVGLPLAGILMVRKATTRESYSRTMFLVTLGLAVAFVTISSLRPPMSGLPLRSPLFTLALMFAAFPNTRWRQLIPPLFMTVGLVWLGIGYLGSSGTDLAGDVVILAALNVAGCLIVDRRLKMERELSLAWESERSAQEALRMLRGIIPICAHCKSVRSELGGWQQIEQYVSEHSTADFSHGICPDCVQKHYADIPRAPGDVDSR